MTVLERQVRAHHSGSFTKRYIAILHHNLLQKLTLEIALPPHAIAAASLRWISLNPVYATVGFSARIDIRMRFPGIPYTDVCPKRRFYLKRW